MQKEFFSPEPIHHFLILFTLPDNVNRVIVKEKRKIRKRFGHFTSHNSVPHITLCTLKAISSRSRHLISKLRREFEKLNEIEIDRDGFDCFESNRVIYAKVKDQEIFKPFFQTLKTFKLNNDLNHSLQISETSHATVAKMESRSHFDQISIQYLHKSFKARFAINELKILQYNVIRNKYDHLYSVKLKR